MEKNFYVIIDNSICENHDNKFKKILSETNFVKFQKELNELLNNEDKRYEKLKELFRHKTFNYLILTDTIKIHNEKSSDKYYKDFIHLNDIPNQRQNFESKMKEYIENTINQLKNKNII